MVDMDHCMDGKIICRCEQEKNMATNGPDKHESGSGSHESEFKYNSNRNLGTSNKGNRWPESPQ